MSVDSKKLEGVIQQRLPGDDAPVVRLTPQGGEGGEGGEALSVHRDAEGRVTDLSCQVERDGYRVAFNEREAIVIDERNNNTRYYLLEGADLHGREQLFHDRNESAAIAPETAAGDRALIDSARRLYCEALEHPEAFELSSVFAVEEEEGV